jgi:hypothetical protein
VLSLAGLPRLAAAGSICDAKTIIALGLAGCHVLHRP